MALGVQKKISVMSVLDLEEVRYERIRRVTLDEILRGLRDKTDEPMGRQDNDKSLLPCSSRLSPLRNLLFHKEGYTIT